MTQIIGDASPQDERSPLLFPADTSAWVNWPWSLRNIDNPLAARSRLYQHVHKLVNPCQKSTETTRTS